MMGQMTAIACVALTVSSLCMGWLSDRVNPALVAKVSALGGCVFAVAQFFVSDFQALVIVRSCLMFCVAGLDPAFQVWLTRSTSEERRGSILGFAVSARSAGWVVASVSSAFLATITGIRSVFLLAAALFLVLIPLAGYASAKVGKAKRGDAST
jgi:DHA1 family multidrug resistance protein-like MFS transporter